MEKGVLCSGFSRQILNIINQQDIYTLIEIDKIIDCIASDSICILYLKKMRRQIQNTCRRIFFLYTYTDSLHQMCFSNARFSIQEQRVKGCLTGFFSNRLTCCTSKFITYSRIIIFKIINRIQLRVQFFIHLLFKRIRNMSCRSAYLRHCINRFISSGNNDIRFGILYDTNLILQLHPVSKNAIQYPLQKIYIMLFQIFVKEIRRNTKCQDIIVKA